jgi:hypothetical protein
MGGRASRAKGMRGEYLVRDYFRKRGWESNRVPLSGASWGKEDKGDVRLTREGKTLVAEVKFRRDDFLSIYGLVDASPKRTLFLGSGAICVVVSYEFDDLGFEGTGGVSRLFEGLTKLTRTQGKLFNLQKLIKSCDFLVIKCNNHPLLFIRFWGSK